MSKANGINEPRQIVIHHTETVKGQGTECAADIRAYHMNVMKFIDIAYHFVIKRDGTIETGRPLKTFPASATGHNTDVVAICLVGNFNIEMPTEEQLTSLRNLILKCCTEYLIPNNVPANECTDMHHIFGHCDYRDPPGKRSCPGKNLHKQIPILANLVRDDLRKVKGVL